MGRLLDHLSRLGARQPDAQGCTSRSWATERRGPVLLDESAVNERTARRSHGYAPVNMPCVQRELLVRGTRFSVLPAMTMDGIIALDIFEGSVNRERLLEFLRNELVR